MIKGNVIYFGYGSILTSHSIGELILREIKPPQQIGSTHRLECLQEENINVISTVVLKVSITDCNKLSLIKNKSALQVEVDGYILDFSNYNKDSVDVVGKHLYFAVAMEIQRLAC